MPAKKAKTQKHIGIVTHWYGKLNVAIVKLLSPLKLGDLIEFRGHHSDFVQKIESMQINHKFVDKTKKGDEIGLKVSHKVREGTLVYKASEKIATVKAPALAAGQKKFEYKPITGTGIKARPVSPKPMVMPKTLPPQRSNPNPKPRSASSSKDTGYGGTKFLKF